MISSNTGAGLKRDDALDPDTRRFLDVLADENGREPQDVSLDEARAAMVRSQAYEGLDLPVTVETRMIPVGPSGQARIHIFRRADQQGALPAVMYFHGGGWVLGDHRTHGRLARELAFGSGAAVVFVDFSRSPEARYPVAIEEGYATTAWIAEHGTSLGLDGSRLAAAGDSAGALIATVVTLLAKERLGPRLACQVLLVPTTDAAFDTPSYVQFGAGYFLSRETMRWFWDQYLPDVSARAEPTAAPLRAPTAQLADLPPALVVTAECDPLRDEGEAYARKLLQAGVPVTATRYLGTIHAFVVLDPLRQSQPARAAIAQAAFYLSQALRRAPLAAAMSRPKWSAASVPSSAP